MDPMEFWKIFFQAEDGIRDLTVTGVHTCALPIYYFFAKPDSMADLFFWPALDIFLWGMTSVWIQHTEQEFPKLAIAILTGLVFWQIVWRSNYEIAVNMLQEFWNRNLVNLFSTPLKLSEWIVAMMLYGMFKIVVTIFFGALVV